MGDARFKVALFIIFLLVTFKKSPHPSLPLGPHRAAHLGSEDVVDFLLVADDVMLESEPSIADGTKEVRSRERALTGARCRRRRRRGLSRDANAIFCRF